MMIAQTFSEVFHEIGKTEVLSWDGFITVMFFGLLIWIFTR